MQDSPAQPTASHRPTSVAIVGTDVVLAAFPATPVQIAHACHELGYDVVVPASWGDELVAAAALERAGARGSTPVVLCACPRVSERLVAAGGELAPFLLPLVSPPVAAARYVRALHDGAPVTVTYLGACGGALAPDIDARLTPRDFLAAVAQRGIVLGDLPRVFDSVLPPDRRRHFSLPGGLPAAAHLEALATPRRLACLTSADYAAEVAQHLLAGEPVMVDVAPRLGCACTGAGGGTPHDRARDTVASLEPPRAHAPVLDHDVAIALDATLPSAPAPAREDAAPPPRPAPARGRGAPAPAPRPLTHTPPGASPRFAGGEPTTGGSRRRSSVTGFFRGYTTDVPRTRSGEGPTLPRAYVALRRAGTDTPPSRPGAPAGTDRERAIPREVEPPPAPVAQAAAPAAATPPMVPPVEAAVAHPRTRAAEDATVGPGSPAALRAVRRLDPAMVRVVPPPSGLRAQRELYVLAAGALLFVLLLLLALLR